MKALKTVNEEDPSCFFYNIGDGMFRNKILKGAQTLARAVSATYGPHGRIALIDRGAGAILGTKDGVTVARDISLPDPVEDIGAKIMQDACLTVNNAVGDGTTSTAVMSLAILEEGHKLITAGYSVAEICKQLDAGMEQAIKALLPHAVEVEAQETIERVAMIATNGDVDVSSKIAEATMVVGRDGTLTVEDGKSLHIELDYVEGIELESGAASLTFLQGEAERHIDRPLVAVVAKHLRTVEDIRSILEDASQWPNHPLVLFCEHIEGEALTTMTVNDSQGTIKCVAVNAPGFAHRKKDFLKDIAAVSGAVFVDDEVGQEWDDSCFGGLEKIVVREKTTTLESSEAAEEGIAQRVEEIKAQARHNTSEYDADRTKERIAKLTGGLCVLRVGGVTEAEMKERRARIEDALGAVSAALDGGIVPGGGKAYALAAEGVTASPVLRKALLKPLFTLTANAGLSGDNIVAEASKVEAWEGFDFKSQTWRDYSMEPAIIDPVNVAIEVIKASVSVGKMLLSIEKAVVKP